MGGARLKNFLFFDFDLLVKSGEGEGFGVSYLQAGRLARRPAKGSGLWAPADVAAPRHSGSLGATFAWLPSPESPGSDAGQPWGAVPTAACVTAEEPPVFQGGFWHSCPAFAPEKDAISSPCSFHTEAVSPSSSHCDRCPQIVWNKAGAPGRSVSSSGTVAAQRAESLQILRSMAL